MKSDICAEVKSDMSTIRADLITELHAMENKMGNCMSAIMELKTQIVTGELEQRLDKQHKNVTSMVKQQTRNLRELEAQLAVVEARTRCAGGGSPVADDTTVKPLKFDCATSWAVIHQQFETAAVQNNWTPKEKAAHLLSVLQGQGVDILHTVLAEAMYEDIVEALWGCFGDNQLAADYRSQLKTRVQGSGKILQWFATAVEQLAH